MYGRPNMVGAGLGVSQLGPRFRLRMDGSNFGWHVGNPSAETKVRCVTMNAIEFSSLPSRRNSLPFAPSIRSTRAINMGGLTEYILPRDQGLYICIFGT